MKQISVIKNKDIKPTLAIKILNMAILMTVKQLKRL